MSSDILKKSLKRFTVSELPLIYSTAKRLKIPDTLNTYISRYGNEKINWVETLLLLIGNITSGRKPLYKLSQWVETIHPNILGTKPLDPVIFNDDRFGRALDKLYISDRASLMIEIVKNMIQAVDLKLNRIHNDSTSVKAYGKISGRTKNGFHLAYGHSKDHRPDLKQLIFTLSITSDGAVPIHYKTYPGNRADDTVHIETWTMISQIIEKRDFIYIADSKVCTAKQLSYITGQGGRVVTIMPKTWKETAEFNDKLRKRMKKKKRVWRNQIPEQPNMYENIYLFSEKYFSNKEKYRIYWYYSSQKAELDYQNREGRLLKAENELGSLMLKINKRDLKENEAIEQKTEGILKQYKVKEYLSVTISAVKQSEYIQIGRGRPGPTTKYRKIVETIYTLQWERNTRRLKQEKNTDGIFPLLSTDKSLSGRQAIKYYKHQPKLEKRFMQFKSIHNAAPLFFKKIERVESIMFLFFISIMIQAVIEREVRKNMKEKEIKSLDIYPENRPAFRPTTSKILDNFENVYYYQINSDGKVVEEYRDDLNDVQQQLLSLLNISKEKYWPK